MRRWLSLFAGHTRESRWQPSLKWPERFHREVLVRLLLDTHIHILLWALIEPGRLPSAAGEALEAPENRVFFSAANIWEIAIKRALDRLDFAAEPGLVRSAALRTGFEELPVSGLHALRVRGLSHLHRDPFDRLLIAQAGLDYKSAQGRPAHVGLRAQNHVLKGSGDAGTEQSGRNYDQGRPGSNRTLGLDKR